MANKSLRGDNEGTIVHDAALALEHAPDDVLDIVCTKLGLDDIAACRGVCRRFREFIDNPRFVALWNKQHKPSTPVYIARQDERCNAVGVPEEGWHRFLELWGTGCMKLMATTYALMCFLHGDRQLVVVNPLTGQARKLPPLLESGGSGYESKVVAAGIHFDRSAGEYTVIAAMTESMFCRNATLCMATYRSATGSWSQLESRNTSGDIKKTSPMVWFEGAFYWTVGEPYKKQLVLKLKNRWVDLKVAPPEQGKYLELRVVGCRLLLGDEWRVETRPSPRIVPPAAWDLVPRPDTRYVVCYSDAQTRRMVFQMIDDNHECCIPDEKDLFTLDYLSPPKYCSMETDLTRFEFSFGLGI